MQFVTKKLMTVTGRRLLGASLILLAPALSHASYLSDLEAEANSTGADTKPEATWTHKQQGLSDSFSRGMDQKGFEQSLRDNYYGSFIFYEKLSDWDKMKVFETYQSTNSIDRIRDEIKARMTK